MTPVRLVFYVIDPFTDTRAVIGALVATESSVTLVRAPIPDLPEVARANVERVLIDLEAATTLDPLPIGAGAQVVGGVVVRAGAPFIRAGLGASGVALPRRVKGLANKFPLGSEKLAS